MSDPECEQTHEALRKLPLDWFRLAGLIYIKQMPVYLAAEDVGMSRAQGYRVQGLIFKGVEFLIRNPRLKDPPLHLLLKS
ncbi:hypothetical protein [Cupriavidus sp. H18C1]|uniref:hypothetical protein n=1 Tax=Cupriavidus sp. H18C1 TaxID=3241601 RepID=UPI003BB8A721